MSRYTPSISSKREKNHQQERDSLITIKRSHEFGSYCDGVKSTL